MSYHSLATLVVCCLLVTANAGAQRSNVSTIRDNGPQSNRVDIAILGDGYTSAEQDKYRRDVVRLVDELFEEEPFRTYESYFNVHRVDITSNQSGAADRQELNRDTALHSHYNCRGLEHMLCVDPIAVKTAFGDFSPDAQDVVIVLVNDTRFGGSGTSAAAVASTGGDWVELLLHELGHHFGDLADEYYPDSADVDYSGPSCNSRIEPPERNVTRETTGLPTKWRHWIPGGTSGSAPNNQSGIVSVYEGAKYCESGLYRPTFNSKMRSLGMPFEPVNVEELILRIYNRVWPIDSANPEESELRSAECERVSFSVQTPGRPQGLPGTLETTWTIDGTPVGTGNSLEVVACDLAVGQHRVEVEVRDMTPAVRRWIPAHSWQWDLTVSR